jgi:hypothetical protein
MKMNKPFASEVREFLLDLLKNDVIPGKEYSVRIELDDGGYNSYIGLNFDIESYDKTPVMKGLRIYRHTNSFSNLGVEWGFRLGSICYLISEYPGVPIEFSSYGVTVSEAEEEASKYFSELKKLIQKKTSEYGYEITAEKERLLARLNELDNL